MELLEPLDALGPLTGLLYWPLVYPLKLVYFLGYWSGREPAAICAELTGHRLGAAFFTDNPAVCDTMLEEQFLTWSVSLGSTLYLLTVVYLCKRCLGRFC